MGKKPVKKPDIKKMDEAVGKKFSIKWSVVSWLVSLAIFIGMSLCYSTVMEQGGGTLYRTLTILMGAMVIYRFILIVYNIIQKRKEK
ncbi:MAG: hypothetical protein SNG14_05610 [Rikenellaceae bacterium]